MDGDASNFGVVENGPAEAPAPTLTAVALDLDRPRADSDRLRHATCLALAAATHALLIAAFLLPRTDALGDEGVALETIAVSIVDAVPVIAAPEPPPSPAAEQPLRADKPINEPEVPHEVVPEVMQEPQTPEPHQPTEEETTPKPERPALALDLPPEPTPPPPDALVLPARPPELEPWPEPVVRDATPPPIENKEDEAEKQEQKTETKQAVAKPPPPPLPPPPPPAPAAPPAVSSAEAAPGVVRAYARRISIALDKGKPRSRGMRGKVVVQFTVDTDGKPLPPKVLASSGNPRLDDLVVGAISRIGFPSPPPEMSLRQRTFNVPFEYR